MDRLEAILESIDHTEIGVDQLAAQVQEATDLLKTCRHILTETEKNVQAAIETLDDEFDESQAEAL